MSKPLPEQLFLRADALPAVIPAWEYHAHTTFSDGALSVAETVAVAQEAGLHRLIFTEHTEPDITAGPGWFLRYLEEVGEMRRVLGERLALWAGLEVPVVDFAGGLLMDEEMGERAEFLLGAVHAFPGHGWNLSGIEAERAIDLEYRALMGLLENPRIHALAHPGGVCHRFVTPFPMERFEAVVAKAAGRGVAIELNPAYQEPLAPYLEVCARHGALISPGSNVHHPDQLGDAWRELARLNGEALPPSLAVEGGDW